MSFKPNIENHTIQVGYFAEGKTDEIAFKNFEDAIRNAALEKRRANGISCEEPNTTDFSIRFDFATEQIIHNTNGKTWKLQRSISGRGTVYKLSTAKVEFETRCR